MKKLIYILPLILLTFACQSEPLIVESDAKELKFEKGILSFKKKPFSGKIVSFHKNSKVLKSEKSYENGVLHGREKTWFSNGVLASDRLYEAGIKVGRHIGFWPHGQLKYEFYFNNLGQHHGEANEWFSNGEPLRYFNYQNGKEEGSQKMFKIDGSLRSNYVVRNGERFGLIGLKKCDAVSTL